MSESTSISTPTKNQRHNPEFCQYQGFIEDEVKHFISLFDTLLETQEHRETINRLDYVYLARLILDDFCRKTKTILK